MPYGAAVLGLIFFIAAIGCRKFEAGSKDDAAAPIRVEKTVTAASDREGRGIARFHFRLTGKPWIYNFSQLPKKGLVDPANQPWSGYWFPEYKGGTDYRSETSRSALEVYDAAFHADKRAQEWERAHHSEGQAGTATSWYGHCNGFAASSQRHNAPQKTVQKGGQSFEPHHIRALLAEIYMSHKDVFLGGNDCEAPAEALNFNPAHRPLGAKDVAGACENVSPGIFHLVLGNWLGVLRHAIIFDRQVGLEKWNFPLFSFDVLEAESVTEEEATKLVTETAGPYVFNTAASAWKLVKVQIQYADARASRETSIDRFNTYKTLAKQKTYVYVLELSELGDVIGGEWAKAQVSIKGEDGSTRTEVVDSRRDHPDYLWSSFEPGPVNPGSSARQFGNPHLDKELVLEIWRESVDEARRDYAEPEWENYWGDFQRYSISLNGLRSGAVFLGPKVVLRVARKGDWAQTELDLKLQLNDDGVKTFKLNAGQVLEAEIEPRALMNRLALRWVNADGVSTQDSADVRFHAFP